MSLYKYNDNYCKDFIKMLKNKKTAILLMVLLIEPVHAMNWKKIVAGVGLVGAVTTGIYYLIKSNHDVFCRETLTAQEEKVNYEIARYNREKILQMIL